MEIQTFPMLASILWILHWLRLKPWTVGRNVLLISVSMCLWLLAWIFISCPAMQLSYPGTKISTLQEVFQFADCADPKHQILWNIESKIDAINPNNTHGVGDFVMKQHVVFMASSYPSSSITVCFVFCVSNTMWQHLLVPESWLEDTGWDEGQPHNKCHFCLIWMLVSGSWFPDCNSCSFITVR